MSLKNVTATETEKEKVTIVEHVSIPDPYEAIGFGIGFLFGLGKL